MKTPNKEENRRKQIERVAIITPEFIGDGKHMNGLVEVPITKTTPKRERDIWKFQWRLERYWKMNAEYGSPREAQNAKPIYEEVKRINESLRGTGGGTPTNIDQMDIIFRYLSDDFEDSVKYGNAQGISREFPESKIVYFACSEHDYGTFKYDLRNRESKAQLRWSDCRGNNTLDSLLKNLIAGEQLQEI